MSNKRPAFTSLSNLVAKKEKIDSDTAIERSQLSQAPSNPFLARPVYPEDVRPFIEYVSLMFFKNDSLIILIM